MFYSLRHAAATFFNKAILATYNAATRPAWARLPARISPLLGVAVQLHNMYCSAGQVKLERWIIDINYSFI